MVEIRVNQKLCLVVVEVDCPSMNMQQFIHFIVDGQFQVFTYYE